MEVSFTTLMKDKWRGRTCGSVLHKLGEGQKKWGNRRSVLHKLGEGQKKWGNRRSVFHNLDEGQMEATHH